MMFPIIVNLDEDGMQDAEKHALKREAEANKRSSKHRYDNPFGNDGNRQHIMGCQGELAASYALGIPWPKTINTWHKKPDLVYKGKAIEVRTRDGKLSPCLIVKVRDNHYHYALCVIAHPPRFEVAGWIKVGDAKEMKEYFVRSARGDGQDSSIWRIPIEKLNLGDIVDGY